MVPLHYSQHPRSHTTPQVPNSNNHLAQSAAPKYRNEIDRIRQRPLQMEQGAQARAQAQDRASEQLDRLNLQGCPVVWRWVPSLSSPLVGNTLASSLASTSNPRVIYATSNKVDDDSSRTNTNRGIEDSSLVLTGGELQQAREVLSRSNTNFLTSSSTALPTSSVIRIPKAPSNAPGLPPQLLKLQQARGVPSRCNANSLTSSSTALPTTSVIRIPKAPSNAPGLPPQALMSKPSQITENPIHPKDIHPKDGTGGDIEAANLLLNMGGASSDKKSLADKAKVCSPSAASKPANKVSPSDAPQLQEEYLKNWVAGSVSLHTPEDDDVLSPLHCFMRRYCVEAFSAEPDDVATPRYGKSHGFKVEVGQVGIRCLHCKHLPQGKRAERAVCYPSSLRNIYHSIETWQRRHSLVCKHITPWVRKSIMELMESSKTRAGGRRQYWEDSARYVSE